MDINRKNQQNEQEITASYSQHKHKTLLLPCFCNKYLLKTLTEFHAPPRQLKTPTHPFNTRYFAYPMCLELSSL